MKLVIELERDLPEGANLHDVKIVLKDALAEYVGNRANGNGAAYVNERYSNDVYRGAERLKKAASVSLRCKLATAIHSFWDITIQEKDGE